MSIQPITLTRKSIFIVLAVICFAIDCFLAFARIAAPVNVVEGLEFLGFALFALAFL